jgi:large subunit ribosomal protein L13e
MSLEKCLVARKKSSEKRKGRGFSRGELKKASVSVGQALRVGLPVDVRRRTVHEENVRVVRQRLESPNAPKKRASKPKKP